MERGKFRRVRRGSVCGAKEMFDFFFFYLIVIIMITLKEQFFLTALQMS